MGIEFETGEPPSNGHYVAYVRDRTAPEWLRPILLYWGFKEWFFPRSDKPYPEKVFGWSGPLPTGKVDDPIPPTVQEFDL
jgi:hypothetical protein